jgi:hypothetical protein
MSKLAVTITSPAEGDCVGRKFKATGSAENLPKYLTLWQVVEAGGKWHPQNHLNAKSWTVMATVGSSGFGNDKDALFPVHIVAATKTAHDVFTSYLTEQGKTQKWHGVPSPAGAKILKTRVVRRDDHATALRCLIGTYDEYRAKPPRATSGLIRIQGAANGTLTVTASTDAGETVWTGSIIVDSVTGDVTGTYRYAKTPDQGTLKLQLSGDEIAVVGADRIAPAKPFQMAWRNRQP